MTLDLSAEGRVADLDEAEERRLFERALAEDSAVASAAADIIARVRAEGDAALFDLAAQFDGASLEALEVPKAQWKAAAERLREDFRAALDRAARNIGRFHAALVPPPVQYQPEPGVVLERRVAAVRRAGVYAPGGRAAYPSSVLMGAIPARAAGVNEVIVCSPPGPDGEVSAPVLAACWFSGADRLFAVGGAGAVAAMALGTQTIPRVDVLVGPGNAYVNEAKRLLAGTVRIDSPAGPSELLVLADASARPDWVAAELVAQAEHDVDACVGAVCIGSDVAADLRRALTMALNTAPRAEIARAALARHGFILAAESRKEALRFANRYAAEHLSLMISEPGEAAERMRSSGTIFVGGPSSVAFGDYMTGANHVLPTAGTSRSFSGLGAEHFLRSYTVQTLTTDAAAAMAEATGVFADAEGLPGHAAAARLRSAPSKESRA